MRGRSDATLPGEFSNDEERVARFHREAQSIAALNHPNIAAIYELSEANATRFLVLELVEGETLAERSSRGALPTAEAFATPLGRVSVDRDALAAIADLPCVRTMDAAHAPEHAIEVELPSGVRLRVNGMVDEGALRQILSALS